MLLDCYKPTFARSFNGTSATLEAAFALNVPLTMACWFNQSSLLSCAMINVSDDSNTNRIGIYINTTSGSPVQAIAGASSAFTTTSANSVRWNHAVGVFASATSRTAYLNGGGKSTDTTSNAVTGINRINISGRYSGGTLGTYFNGLIAWPAVWNVALTDADVAMLAAGARPTTVKPESLVAFWDWTGAEKEFGLKAAYPLTNTGSTPVNGPAFLRTRVPRPWMLGAGYVAPAGGNRRRRTIICGVAA